ncbi:SusD/RagB family nutrient-binding outer membrane lipoprotein [Spirosoma soli]|uniref:SusD/RagB family nutrient-binding outer membrane lipoprotein n=1 Tax=Spirosoma soli TaxID=1770529 RepID=A0ABW5M2B6_9BACT
MKLKVVFLLTALTLASSACKEQFFDINTNPNTLPTATPNFVFTNALKTTTWNPDAAGNLLNVNELGSYWSGQWTQSNGYIISTTQFGYNFTNGDFNYWDGYYDNLNDYQFVIDNADANGQKFLKGPAKVMKALIFQQLVDMYGNVPYTEALKGGAVLAPKFDDQKAVYESLITLLDEAASDIKAGATELQANASYRTIFNGTDIIFGGNITKWAQFANSVKMRILMRQSRVAGRDAYIKTEINKIVSGGAGFITGEDVAVGGPNFFVATAGKINPIYDRWGYSETNARRALNNFPRITQFLINSLKASGDTLRMKRIAYAVGNENQSNPGTSTRAEIAANYVGTPFGASSGFLPGNTSAVGPSLLIRGQFNRPFVIMTAAEVQLNLAEAKQRYADVTLPNTAQAYFEEGIKQSFRALGANTAGADAFKGSKVVNYSWDASPDKLAAISIQKWLAAANLNGFEAWSEYRKTGLPVTPQSVQVTDARRPVRLFYPNTEAGSNTANVTAQGTVDVFNTKLFWDVD